MAILDEDQPYAPRRAPAPRRRGPERQQIVARRLMAGAIGIVILILLIVGIKGCLDARKQRGLENFASDVNSLVASSSQLSNEFFKELQTPGSSGLNLQQAIESERGTAEGLLTRAEQISTPGELAAAKSNLVLAFQLRRDGIAGLAAQLASANGSPKQLGSASRLAVDHMKELLASDVIYVRAKAQIDAALKAEGLSERARPSVFFHQPTRWLSKSALQTVLGSAGTGGTGGSACPPKHVCGLALASTAIGGAALTAGAPATVTGTSVDVSVQNQGDVSESGVQVTFKLSGGGTNVTNSATLPQLPAGQTKSVSLPIKPAATAGRPLSLDVTVQPVPGEHVSSNNRATYSVTFG